MKTVKQAGLIAVLLFVCTVFSVDAQDTTKTAKRDTVIDGKEIFIIVETRPEFPGGDEARIRFLQENLVYPKEAWKKKLQGKVVIGFVVEADGSLTDFSVVKSVSSDLDAEALRVCKLMPNWTPGSQKGNPVRVRFVMPITFSLQ